MQLHRDNHTHTHKHTVIFSMKEKEWICAVDMRTQWGHPESELLINYETDCLVSVLRLCESGINIQSIGSIKTKQNKETPVSCSSKESLSSFYYKSGIFVQSIATWLFIRSDLGSACQLSVDCVPQEVGEILSLYTSSDWSPAVLVRS